MLYLQFLFRSFNIKNFLLLSNKSLKCLIKYENLYFFYKKININFKIYFIKINILNKNIFSKKKGTSLVMKKV